MTPRLQVIAVCIGIGLFICIIELVRRRKLREEYSWLWLLTGVTIVVLSLWYEVLVFISRVMGDIFPSAALFFLGLIFLLLITLCQSVKISELTDQIKMLSQAIALMNAQKREKEKNDSLTRCTPGPLTVPPIDTEATASAEGQGGKTGV